MGGEVREIRVVITVEDPQHWHPGWLAAANASDIGCYGEWAMVGLRKAVREAADKYVADHPDLFATEPDVI